MKKYLSLLAISAFLLVAQPTSAIVVDGTTNFNLTLSQSTSIYQTTGFQQIGIVASAADQDGLKLLTVQRYTVTGALATLGTTACERQKGCAVVTSLTPTDRDAGSTISLLVTATDVDGNVRTSRGSIRVGSITTRDTVAPAGSMAATPNSFTVDSGASPIVELRANVTDNTELKSVRFYRTNPQTGSEESVGRLITVGDGGVTCNTAKTSCTANDAAHAFGSIRFTDTSPAYYNVPYYAIVRDAAGNETRTASVNVRINNAPRTTPPPSTRTVPTVTITPSRTTAGPSNTITLSASASSDGGVYAVEVRALPSWSSVTTKKRCTLSSGPRTGTCSLDIGPYTDRTSGTIKVWAIAWDNTSGLGGNSGEKTVTLTVR